jgi:PAS domain S-box-containing protein
MNNTIFKILDEEYDTIVENYVKYVQEKYASNFSPAQINKFVKNILKTIVKVVNTSDYSQIDKYLKNVYHLFSEAQLGMDEIKNIFRLAESAIIDQIEKRDDAQIDISVNLKFFDSIAEQFSIRYELLNKKAELSDLEKNKSIVTRQLEMNQRYLQSVLYSSDAAIMVIDKDEKIVNWNKGAQDIFGYSEKEIIGKPSSFLLPPEKKFKEELEYIKRGTIKNGFLKIPETERINKSGKRIPIQLNVTLITDGKNNYTGRTVIIKDTSEVQELKQQVNQSEKLAVIGQLAAGVAHEIGNPLTAISSLVQILQRKATDQFVSQQLINIKENIDRISKIVRELVDFSRTPSYQKEIVLITDILKTAIGIVRYDKRVKSVDFKTEFSAEIPAINIVPDQLLQIFVNILLNALDAMDGNGTVTVRTYKDLDYIYTEIQDNGCGIDEKNIDKIFNPFFTTKKVGKGTGLGLSVSYGIVKKFKGDILIKSKVNKGSTFIIKLPINDNQDWRNNVDKNFNSRR